MKKIVKIHKDKFGVRWNLPKNELCSECGQPDSCGECSHKKMTKSQVKFLGGIINL